MAFDLNIKNIGKLSNAKIRIGKFTVFAGANNTGKSTVSKLLYSLFDGMNANHVEIELNKFIVLISHGLYELESFYGKDSIPHFDDMSKLIRELEIISKWCASKENQHEFDTFQNVLPNIVDVATKMKDKVIHIKEILETIEPIQKSILPSKQTQIPGVPRKRYNENIEAAFNKLSEGIDTFQKSLGKTPDEFIADGITSKIFENLTQNFQIPSISNLRCHPENFSSVNIEDIGTFRFEEDNTISMQIDRAGIWSLQNYSRVIYLESPIYWKLKTPLENARRSTRYYTHILGRRRLSGVPGYFYDLIRALEEQYTGEIAFPELYEKLTSQKVINGKIILSESGELLFQERGRTFPLSITAMGVVNLGVLALLIERKTIDKGSFLFIDEPEAHLHPAWQVVMAETLFELAKGGVNVVIATHSADILKWLEVHVKKNPEDENLIALNKFPADENEPEEQDFEDKIAAIKQELTKPFADLYTQGL